MTYPVSGDVTAGQPTSSDHYNNLRADCLRLGAAAADGANLGNVLNRFESKLTIELLDTDRLRIPCTNTNPGSIVIDGVPLYSVNNIDLDPAGKPTGTAAMWHIFALRTAGNTSFKITVSTSDLEYANYRRIGSFYWTGTAIAAPSIRTRTSDYIKQFLNYYPTLGCQGRLSLDPATPSLPDQSGTVLYLIPFRGNLISLYTPGWGWNVYPIEGAGAISLSLSSLLTTKCYDVFAYVSGYNILLENLAWTNLLSRATSLAWQDGILVKSTDKSRIYLGTFTPSDATTINDLVTSRTLWNYYNRLPRPIQRVTATATWTYNVATWRQANSDAANAVKVVTGIAEDVSTFEVDVVAVSASGYYPLVGLGLDSVTVNSAEILAPAGSGTMRSISRCRMRNILSIGCHDINWLEYIQGASTCTYHGVNLGSISGLSGLVMG
jgi:hypothetical protein